MADPSAIGWREVVAGLSVGFTALLGIVWKRQSTDVAGKLDRTELAPILAQFAQHVADDKELAQLIRDDRKASELSRDELHRKFNKMALIVARLDERLAHIGTRSGETLGPIGDGDDTTPRDPQT